MSDGVSIEPVIAPLPTPVAVEPRTVAPAEAAEIARQADEAKVAADSKKPEPKAAEPVKTEPKKPVSTREALRAAAAKVNAEPATPLKTEPAAKVAEPAKVAPKAADAKAAEPVPVAKTEPARAEDGKFVSTKPADPAAKAAEPVKAAADPAASAAAKAPALPSHTAEPPPARFSAVAKEKWAEAPDEVRAEVTRAVSELTKGFEKHREAATRDAEIAEFHEMATKGGTTVKQALSSYVNMENVLRADPIKGFELICQNAGISFRDVASKYLNQTPEESASKADATILALQNKIAELEKGLGGIVQEREQQKTDSTSEMVAKFAADHPRFDELVDDIALFLKTKTKDLAEAYSLAERLNPAPAAPAKAEEVAPVAASSAAPVVEALKLVTPAAPAHTDRGQKSIAGAPTAGSDPARKPRSSSVQESIRRARSVVG